jgi:hypothetical protein
VTKKLLTKDEVMTLLDDDDVGATTSFDYQMDEAEGADDVGRTTSAGHTTVGPNLAK